MLVMARLAAYASERGSDLAASSQLLAINSTPDARPCPARAMPFFIARRSLHCDSHSFPTRRSSDLRQAQEVGATRPKPELALPQMTPTPLGRRPRLPNRSEEHTSELQSQLQLVCRLLLENRDFG